MSLFGTLSLATRSLATQRNGTEVAGHNLANVNTKGYSRQRVAIETSLAVAREMGPQGTGADAVGIYQLRDALVDRQIVNETGVRGAYESRQRALQFGQAALGQQIDRQASGAEGAAAFTELNLSGGLAQLAQQRDDSWPTIFRLGSTIPASDYIQAMRLRAKLQQEMAVALSAVDVVVAVPNEGSAIYWTNLCGQPTIITRCGMRDGKPESLEFYGKLDAEALILRVALAYEQETDWHNETPKL